MRNYHITMFNADLARYWHFYNRVWTKFGRPFPYSRSLRLKLSIANYDLCPYPLNARIIR